ncbi:MAG: pyruvate, phosphate dikinase [Sulfolobales archaeon]|nr:pyruvate, phosphate dikinase [Sulfolobales archaeon]MDW7969791.1 pyruvate, phosphate dikinase [Sulfolobales archaeon]
MGSEMTKKYVFSFEEGDWRDKKLLGGKGASLAQMVQLGLPVPPGFTITTEACRDFYSYEEETIEKLVKELERGPPPDIRDKLIGEVWKIVDRLPVPEGLFEQVKVYVKKLEEKSGKIFGDPNKPLLVSVRSGAAVSMPGMMDTVLNLGLNDEVVKGLARLTNNEWFAYDAYRRFLQMFGRIVLGIKEELFDEVFKEIKSKYGVKYDVEVPVEGLKEAVERFKHVIQREWGSFPQDPWVQLELAVKAVFRSWMNPRAIFYRMANKISKKEADCTAVNVVAMVFGNMGWDSGTGVLFTRDVANGENRPYGEFLPNAQGEDVVAGIRTPMPLDKLKEMMPQIYDELIKASKVLERLNKDVQDIEFTIEKGKLYFLQNRDAKMTPLARVKTAVDLVMDGILTKEEALLKVKPEHIVSLLYPRIDPKYKGKPIAKGLGASPGAVSGQVVFHPDVAVEWARNGKKVILVRVETKPDDVHGFYAAVGVLTSRGGMTSHAAVVARAIGKSAVVGAEAISINYDNKEFRVGDLVVREGEWITIDGTSGDVYVGKIPTVEPELISEVNVLLGWADEVRKLGVRANADVPEDAVLARKFGAEGIGLLRIERMFRKPERLNLLRKVILAENVEERVKYLEPLAEMIKKDFKEILEIMDGLPVIIRLIDPPLHEFLPAPEEILKELYESKIKGVDDAALKEFEWLYNRISKLKEHNPMMGHRGVRVGVTYPEFYYYLTKSMVEATAELIKEGKNPILEIMIPQVALASEIKYVKEKAILPAIKDVESRYGISLLNKLKIGTMIETVRACLTADEIAKEVDFFSYGTNDLTQATFSFSRDDIEGKFLPQYIESGVLMYNPFETLDDKGVAKLIEIGTKLGKSSNQQLEVGICGEHGGDPKSIEILHRIGLDYVSASPYRVVVARLAAAHAAIKYKSIS